MGKLCEVCKEREYTQLCDFGVGSGIVTSVDFQELTDTCDKKMCKDCATKIWHNADLCPEHAIEVHNNITDKIISLNEKG